MRVRYRNYSDGGISPILAILVVNLLIYVFVFIVSRIAPQLALKIILLLALPMPAGFLSQPWSILTSVFLHTRFWHIFGNMITLYFFGTYFNRLVGEKSFLIVYFVGGTVGNFFLLLLSGLAPYPAALGASGAVFALAGGLVVMRPRLPVIIFPIPIPMPLFVAVLGGFVILSFLPWVAWQAHLGGLIVGLIAGYISRKRERHSFF